MALVDANIVLRYLLDDHPELSPKAVEIIEEKDVLLPMEAACEVVYVLQKVYKVDRDQIQQYLSELVSIELVAVEKPDVFLKALECYSSTSLDFVDTLLRAYHAVEQQEGNRSDPSHFFYAARGRGGTSSPWRRAVITSARYFHGQALRFLHVSITLASMANT